MDAWWGFVGVVIGSVITGIVAIGGQLLRGRQDADLDGQKRTNDREIERDRIQRDTLLELQHALGAWLRVQVRIGNTLAAGFEASGRAVQIPADLTTEAVDRLGDLFTLTERVKDDDLRRAFREVRAYLMPLKPADAESLEAHNDRLSAKSAEVELHLGEVLRQYL